MSAAKPRHEFLWTETARTDVEEFARFISHDSVENAIYRRDADRVYVLGVLDGRRALASLLLERLIR